MVVLLQSAGTKEDRLRTLPQKAYAIPYVIPSNPYGKAYKISLDPVEIIGSGNPYGNPKTSYITYGNP